MHSVLPPIVNGLHPTKADYSVNPLSSGRCNKVFQESSLSKPETYELKTHFRSV